VPVIAVVGKKEAEERSVAIRRFGSQDQHVMSLSEAVEALTTEATPPDLRRRY
jgi:threonyl-tRNA synthetase